MDKSFISYVLFVCLFTTVHSNFNKTVYNVYYKYFLQVDIPIKIYKFYQNMKMCKSNNCIGLE